MPVTAEHEGAGQETAAPVSPCVLAVARAPRHGFSKQVQPSIRLIAGEGVEGDAHRGVTVQHLYHVRRDPTQPNLCQVHLFASEALEELLGAGFEVAPGELGENVVTAGVALLTLPQGTRMRLGPEALLELTGLRTPCSKIDKFRPGLQARLWGPRQSPRRGSGQRERRAGVMARVLVSGEVRPGDAITVELPPEPHRPLDPV